MDGKSLLFADARHIKMAKELIKDGLDINHIRWVRYEVEMHICTLANKSILATVTLSLSKAPDTTILIEFVTQHHGRLGGSVAKNFDIVNHNVHSHSQTHKHSRAHTQTYTRVRTHAHAHTQTHTHTQAHTQTHTSTCTRTETHAHNHTQAHTHTHIMHTDTVCVPSVF